MPAGGAGSHLGGASPAPRGSRCGIARGEAGLNILHVIPTYVPAYRHGGPVHAVHGLAKALVALGHRVTVLTTDVHGSGTLAVPLAVPVDRDGVEVRYFPVSFPRGLYRSPQLGRAVCRVVGGYDVVHLHSLFLWPIGVAADAARRADVPYLLAPRGMLVRDLVRRRSRLRKLAWLVVVGKRVLEGAAALHALTRWEAEEAARFGIPLPPIVIVPNGVDAEAFGGEGQAAASAEIRGAMTAGPFLLCLGRVSWKKGIDRAIRALAHCPETRLLVAGGDDEGLTPALVRLARKVGVVERVRFLGEVHGADKAALLREAIALVLPSLGENFAVVVLEAMAAGTAVVVTPEVGLADTVREAGAGVVVPGEPKALGGVFRELLAAPEHRRAMGERGRALARQRFAWPAVARRMAAVYAEILAQHRAGSGARA